MPIFAGRYDIRLDDLVYGVWAIVSTRHMGPGQDTSVFTVTGRDRSFRGHDTVIGLVDQDFPLIISAPGDMNFLSWIRQVENIAAKASAHAHIGFKRILETASAGRPQVKVCINMINDDQQLMTDDDDFSLVFNLSVSTELKLSMRHNMSVQRCDVRVLLDHFTATLHHVLENPQTSISALEIMSPIERQLLKEYGKSAFRPSRGLMHRLVEQQARLSPDADAVQFEMDAPLTYSTLNRRSNQLARHLRQFRAAYIVVHMRTSADFIVALLAILKAGAAYVILDPDAPAARKSSIINDVQADFVVVDETTAGEFNNEYLMSHLLDQAKDNEDGHLKADQAADSIAYVIYTSGSTGKPKGVLLEHQAAFNGLLAFPQHEVANLRQLLFFNPVFSAAQRSIWATLSVGGCLCLASKENLTVHTAKTINMMKVSSIDMTSTTATLISPDEVPSLRRITLGGEMVNPTIIKTWATRVQLLSSYGLSECTQLNWRHKLQNHVGARIIGQPLDTTTSYVLAPGGTSLSPLLVPGELCLGGPQLAKGYLNHPHETEKRFIRNPFGQGRLYRTGDTAIRHADGSIELIGRIDFQVKINGQRVDPSEPNTVIQLHEKVEQSAVVPTLVGNKTALVAVVISRIDDDGWESLVENLRSFLSTRMPLYMIPSYWVAVSELSLNANGKVDMPAIRSMVEDMARSGQLLPNRSNTGIIGATLTATESVLIKLWSEFLPVSELEILPEDSFVSLGGSSLEAIQIVSRLQSQHSLILRVEDIILSDSLSRVASLAQTKSGGTKVDGNGATPAKFALLAAPASSELHGISTSEIEDAFPVTPFQEAVIAHTMMGGTSYTYSRAYSFDGHSPEAVKDALVSLIESDGFLRTTFFPEGSSFLQVVRKSADIPWETSNINLKEYLQQEISKPMHAGGLWWRAAALPGSILVITLHHALFDYWSSDFLPYDLSSLLLGRPQVDRPVFSRYVEHLHQHDDITMQEFWMSYLDGVRPTRLGGSRDYPETTATAKLDGNIKSAASKLRVTPSVLVYASWAVVLSLAGDVDDVVMGVTLSGRDAPVQGILHLNGPALQVAPLRVKVDKEISLRAHLENVQSSLWDVAKHSQYGLRNILKASGQPKDLLDTAVNFLIKMLLPTLPGGLRRLPEQCVGPLENVKLELSDQTLDRITLSSTMEPEFAQVLVNSVATILQAASDAPLSKISHFRLVRPAGEVAKGLGLKEEPNKQFVEHGDSQSGEHVERPPEDWVFASATSSDQGEHGGRSLEDWSSASSASSDQELGHSALQRMAASYPGKTAVEDASGNRISYAGLAIKINQLAGLLQENGVGLEQLVPLMLEKSINTIVAMFGVLAAGGAFLPLGPENPRERNLGILQDSEARIVITDRLNAAFFDGSVYQVIVIDDVAWDMIPIKPQFVPGMTPDSLAYVIYTSGSTGKPKGTLLTHRALSTAVDGIIDSMNRGSSDRVLWSQNYSFDGSFFSLFSALSSGCTLCVAPQNTIVANIAELINKMNVNHVTMTPSMASLFHPDDVPTLEVLGTGGEAVSSYMLEVWAPRITVYSAYGPTEATICVTNRVVTPELNPRNIGRPFRNVGALILDPDTMDPVPRGSVGELCVSGPQLARGYLNRPEATDKVFHTLPNGRFYQTGDLAKWLPNGEVELLGRKDSQVKINGYRVELGEVESVIMQSGLFGQCAVIAATVLKKKQLVAFYSESIQTPGEAEEGGLLLPPGRALDVDHVKEQLTTLPRYMVPTIWLPVSKLPVMVSAKVDRKRLGALAESMGDHQLKEYLPQKEAADVSSEEELRLQSFWSTLFDTPAEDIHANSTFHEMGGDSISALNLISSLRRLGHDIKVNDILSRPTLREQAVLLSQQQANNETTTPAIVAPRMKYQPSDLVYDRLSQMDIFPDDIEDIYPCSPGQIEFLTQGNKPEQFWQLMAVRELPNDFDIDRWIHLTTELTKRNQILRALYLYSDDEKKDARTAVQVVLKNPPLNLGYRSYSTEEEKQQMIEAEWEDRFDPQKPFVRYTILQGPRDGERDLVVKLDHASYDGTLLHIFDDQFKALSRNLPIPKHTPFKEFIGHVISTPKQPQLDYWISQLQNHSFDFPSTAADNPVLSRMEVAKVGTSVDVDALAKSSGVTPPIVFQTAYSLLLAHLSGSRDVIYDNLITGRNVALDNPQLIDGNCANFLPFHSRIADGEAKSMASLLQATQAAFWTSTENGLVSLGEIYEALGRDRSVAAAKCLFCFQPFDAVSAAEMQDPMRWIVMKMSKNKMHFNYALQLEVVKAANKGEYVLRLGYDERVFTVEEAQVALGWYVNCLDSMGKGKLVEELGI
ncbi:NRPS [Amphichorda felina]